MADNDSHGQMPRGFTLRHMLQGHQSLISRIAWSPDGRTLASGDKAGIVQLWNAEAGRLRRALIWHASAINSVAWSPDGQWLASGSGDTTIRQWGTETGRLRPTLEGRAWPINSVAWSPDGRWLASGSGDTIIRLWNSQAGWLRRALVGYSGEILCVAWSPDGRWLASGGKTGAVRLWDSISGQLFNKFDGHSGPAYEVVWSADGRWLASAGDDGTVRLWDVESGQLKVSLEGHTAPVTSISLSSDGRLLASKSFDGAVLLWRCDTWEKVAELGEQASGTWLSGLAFHPKESVLATLGEGDTVIRIWDLDADLLLCARTASRGASYTNAKVALVGDTGVGKTGLGTRLAEGVWRPAPGSTHGMNVWLLHSEPEQDVMLWDFAGQEEYRLVHQLFLNETDVALMLYDPTKSHDTFFGVDYWEKALTNSAPGGVKKILVAARVDVGGVRMTEGDIRAYCEEHGYVAHFATSAETNEGCDELRKAIMAAIPWEHLPRTSSPEVFRRVKDFLGAVRQGNRVLVREHDLMAEFNARADREAPTEAQFRTVIGRVETAGLIKRLSFGDLILLKPELLNGYASDIVDAARRHPDGLGAVSKADVLAGHVPIHEEGGLKDSDKVFLLHATVELFLRLGLALEQDGSLVFPSKFNRTMPQLEEDPVVEVEFSFAGPVENLYTTLIVKLYYGGVFRLKKLWKNAAEFLDGRAHVCGLQLQDRGDGQGMLKVFYAEVVRDTDKALFLKIIADHFAEKGIEVRRERLYRCPACRESVRDRNAVQYVQRKGKAAVTCQYCNESIPLVDAVELLYHDDEKFLAQIAAMESKAEASMERGGDLVAASAEMKTEGFRQWTGGARRATVAIVFTDVVGSTGLTVEMGDIPWRDLREAHFAQARKLISGGQGYFIKTVGDSVMAAFHCAGEALDFALAFSRDTGHGAIRICAGIHVGLVEVASADAFGKHVNLAARIEAKAKEDKARGGCVWVSDEVKEDIDTLRAPAHQHLKWLKHRDEEVRGFPNKRFVLWSVEE